VAKSDPVFLLDTNILTHPVNDRPFESVMSRFVKYRAVIATSAVSVEEALYGVKRARVRRGEEFLADLLAAGLLVFAYRKEAAWWAAEQRARLDRVGKPIGHTAAGARDLMIAATAAVNELILVTDNTADFAGLPVHLENWIERRH
jgi:predicted nucleic acid-binding protein